MFVDNANVNLLDKKSGLPVPPSHDVELDHDHKKKGCCKDCNFTPFVLMIALSFHSIFEGLALGLNLDP